VIILALILLTAILIENLANNDSDVYSIVKDISESKLTASTFFIFSGMAFIGYTLSAIIEFIDVFSINSHDGRSFDPNKKLDHFSSLCRTRTGYVGAVLAHYTIKITISLFITSVMITLFNNIDSLTDSRSIVLSVRLFSIIVTSSNLILIAAYARFIHLLSLRVMRDIEQEDVSE